MACPHARYKEDAFLFETHISVSSCCLRAKDCVECEMMLKLVKEYKPGWISGDDETDKTLYIGLEHGDEWGVPGIIRLLEGVPKGSFRREDKPNTI